MSSQGIDQLLQAMIRERDEFADATRAKLAAMDEAIQARRKASAGLSLFSFGSLPAEGQDSDSKIDKVSPEFSGLAYPAMVHKVLTLQPKGIALTVNQILEVMDLHGVVPEARDPRGTVQTALKRRKEQLDDVVHTGLGEWGLRDWYTESDLKKFARAQNGANARDAEMHKEAMKKGIAAVQARGAFYGKPPKITEDMWNTATRMLAREGKSMREVYDVILTMFPKGEKPIGMGAFNNRKKQFLANEPYPAKWKAYFDQKKREAETMEEVRSKNLAKLSVVHKPQGL